MKMHSTSAKGKSVINQVLNKHEILDFGHLT